MPATDILLIGVDGGATKLSAHAVACDNLAQPASFELRGEQAVRNYQRLPDFAPLPLTEQLAQREAGDIRLSAAETEQGRRWVAAAAEAIRDVARAGNAHRILVGVGMPGLKTGDGRGIEVINNGPRIPDYLDALEGELAASVELVAPVVRLGSDADYCGLGEAHAALGLFRDVANAYYVGGGTGLADALRLRGALVPFDGANSWIMKAWQMPSAFGPTFEKLVSASSLNRVYAGLWGGTEARRHAGTQGGGGAAGSVAATRESNVHAAPHSQRERCPESLAAAGEPVAIAWMDAAALVLAELIFERLYTVKHGRPDAPHRGQSYAELNVHHEYRGLLLDRVVIGQRLGQIYGDERFRGVFGDKLDRHLAALIANAQDAEMAAAYLVGGEDSGPPALRTGFVRASQLRAAPALGAAIAAARGLPAGLARGA